MERYEIRHTVADCTMSVADEIYTASPETAMRQLAHHSDTFPGVFRMYRDGQYIASGWNGAVSDDEAALFRMDSAGWSA